MVLIIDYFYKKQNSYRQMIDNTHQIKSDSALCSLVLKSLKKHGCFNHKKQYQFYYQQELQCGDCFHENLENGNYSDQNIKRIEQIYSLSNIFENPIILTMKESQILSLPNSITKSYLSSFKQEAARVTKKNQFNLLETVLENLQKKVSQLCKQITSRYSSLSQQNNEEMHFCEDQFVRVNSTYRKQLQGMLEEQFSGQKEELEEILRQYQKVSEDPFPQINRGIQSYVQFLENSPYIEWNYLEQLFSKVVDDQLWNLNSIINKNVDKMNRPQNNHQRISDQECFFEDSMIQLYSGLQTLKYSQNNIELQDSNGEVLSKFEGKFDSLYKLPQTQILGVNYEGLHILSYSFGQLRMKGFVSIKGCSEILVFDKWIIVNSKGKILKLHLLSLQYEVIGVGFQNLEKCQSKLDIEFVCKNERSKKCRWNNLSSTFQLVQ